MNPRLTFYSKVVNTRNHALIINTSLRIQITYLFKLVNARFAHEILTNFLFTFVNMRHHDLIMKPQITFYSNLWTCKTMLWSWILDLLWLDCCINRYLILVYSHTTWNLCCWATKILSAKKRVLYHLKKWCIPNRTSYSFCHDAMQNKLQWCVKWSAANFPFQKHWLDPLRPKGSPFDE